MRAACSQCPDIDRASLAPFVPTENARFLSASARRHTGGMLLAHRSVASNVSKHCAQMGGYIEVRMRGDSDRSSGLGTSLSKDMPGHDGWLSTPDSRRGNRMPRVVALSLGALTVIMGTFA